MDVNRIALILVSIANMLLGIFVYSKDRKNAINISFSMITTSLALWTFGVFMIVSTWRKENPIFWVRMAYALGILAIPNITFFSLIFPDRKLSLKKHIPFLYSIAIVLSALSFSPFLIKEIIFQSGRIIETHYGVVNAIYIIYVVTCLMYAFYNLGRSWKREKGIKKQQVQYVFLGISLTMSIMVIINVIITAFGFENASAFGPCFNIILIGFIAYAIVKHRLMDIRVFIRKTIAYSALMVSATSVIGLLVIGVPRAFPNMPDEQSALISLLVGSLTVFIVKPLSGSIKVLMDAFIFKDQQRYRTALRNFSRAVTSELNLDVLPHLLVSTVGSAMQIKKASLWILDSSDETYSLRASSGLKDVSRQNLTPGSPIIMYLKGLREPIVREELERRLPLEEFDMVNSDFRALEAEIAIPLFREDKLIGILNLGSKLRGEIYSNADIEILVSLANQSAIAIQNAQLHKETVDMKNYNEAILGYMNSGVITIDASGKIVSLNNAGVRILGIESEPILGTDIGELNVSLGNLLPKTLEEGNGFADQEIVIQTPEGKEIPLLVSTVPLRSEEDGITGALAVFADISKLKLAEKQLIQASKLSALGTLAAGLAHEIKNPLFSIKTFFQLYPELREEDDEEELQNLSQVAEEEVERIHRILSELLNLGRPPSHSFDWCDVNQIIDDTLLLLKKQFRDKDVDFVDNRGEGLPKIFGDSDQLKQIFLNIILNAVQAIDGDKGRVKVETYQGATTPHVIWQHLERKADENDWITIKISDTGMGIPADKHQQIFDPFYTTKKAGTGLGLAVVHSLIENHGGKMLLESAEGVGSTFIIELPVSGERKIEDDEGLFAGANVEGDKLTPSAVPLITSDFQEGGIENDGSETARFSSR